MLNYYDSSEIFKYILRLMDQEKVFRAFKTQAKKMGIGLMGTYGMVSQLNKKKPSKRASRKISGGIQLLSLKRNESESRTVDKDFDFDDNISEIKQEMKYDIDDDNDKNKFIDILKLFLEYDPSMALFQRKDLNNGKTIAMHAAKLNLVDVFMLVCTQDEKVIDLKDNDGNTAIFHARKSRSKNCFALAIKQFKANLKIKNNDKLTILDVCKNYDKHITKIVKKRKESNVSSLLNAMPILEDRENDEKEEHKDNNDVREKSPEPFTSLLIHKYADNTINKTNKNNIKNEDYYISLLTNKI